MVVVDRDFLVVSFGAVKRDGHRKVRTLLANAVPICFDLTGDYIWRQKKHVEQDKFRPLRVLGEA